MIMQRKSNLVKQLDIKTKEELNSLTEKCNEETREMLSLVIFENYTYEAAAKRYGRKRQAIYWHLIKLHYQKYGKEKNKL